MNTSIMPDGTVYENEDLPSRTRRSQKFIDSDGTSITLVSFLRDRFWLDVNDETSVTKFKPIDENFTDSDVNGYRWTNVSNEFSFNFKENLNQEDSIYFTNKGATIKTQPIYMAYCEMDATSNIDFDSTAFQILETPSDSTGSVIENIPDGTTFTENRLIYNDLYPNCDFIYGSQIHGIKEYIRVKDKAEIPDPTSLGMDPEKTHLVFLTKVNLESVDEIKDEQGIVSDDRNLDTVEFIFNNDTAFGIPKLFGWEEELESLIGISSNVQIYELKKRLVTIDSQLYMLHGISYYELMAANTYPIILDTTIVINPGASADDGVAESGYNPGAYEYTYNNTQYLQVGEYYSVYTWPPIPFITVWSSWIRFPNVTIDQGATINSATISWYVVIRSGYVANSRIYGYDTDNASSTPTNWTSWLTWANTKTTAYTISDTYFDTIGWNSPPCTTVVSEIISRAGWSNGNALGVTVVQNVVSGTQKWAQFYAYDHGSSYPYLTIDYTPSYTPLASTGYIGMGGTVVDRSINLRLSQSATAQISLNDSAVRTLAGIPSGAIDINSFHGK